MKAIKFFLKKSHWTPLQTSRCVFLSGYIFFRFKWCTISLHALNHKVSIDRAELQFSPVIYANGYNVLQNVNTHRNHSSTNFAMKCSFWTGCFFFSSNFIPRCYRKTYKPTLLVHHSLSIEFYHLRCVI